MDEVELDDAMLDDEDEFGSLPLPPLVMVEDDVDFGRDVPADLEPKRRPDDKDLGSALWREAGRAMFEELVAIDGLVIDEMLDVEADEGKCDGESPFELCGLIRLRGLRSVVFSSGNEWAVSFFAVDAGIMGEIDPLGFLTVPSSGYVSPPRLTESAFRTVSPIVDSGSRLRYGVDRGASSLSSVRSTSTLSSVWSPKAGGLSSRSDGDFRSSGAVELANEMDAASSAAGGSGVVGGFCVFERLEGVAWPTREERESSRSSKSERGRWDFICEKRDLGDSR
jgi:hypothetical protein